MSADRGMAADLEQSKPVMDDIRQLLIAHEVPGWIAVVALSTLLGEAVARVLANSTMKGYLRFAHDLVDSAFWAAHG